jgi:hypothetical protein
VSALPLPLVHLPTDRISSWLFIYEPMHEIRTRAYPFTDLIWTIDPITDAHRLMRLID